MNAIIQNFKEIVTDKYAMFKGRAGKAEFWQYVLVYVIISLVFYLIVTAFGSVKVLSILFQILNAIVGLALLVPSLAVSVRRMHDIGKGGGWIFINLIPIIGFIWYIVLAVKDGEPEANRFGEPVK